MAAALDLFTLASNPDSLEALLGRSSASLRAELAWVPQRLRLAQSRLLVAPFLTDRLVDDFVDSFTEVLLRLQPHITELLQPGIPAVPPTALESALDGLHPLPRAALFRSAFTLQALSEVLSETLQKIVLADVLPGEVEDAIRRDAATRLSVRAVLLFLVAVEALHRDDVARGRAVALVLRADRAFHALVDAVVADEPRLRVPWYFADAENPDAVRLFASWSDDLLLEDVDFAGTAAEVSAWLDIQKSLNAERAAPVFP